MSDYRGGKPLTVIEIVLIAIGIGLVLGASWIGFVKPLRF
jgi:hypothetical protein